MICCLSPPGKYLLYHVMITQSFGTTMVIYFLLDGIIQTNNSLHYNTRLNGLWWLIDVGFSFMTKFKKYG